MAERYCLYGKAFKKGWRSPTQLGQMFPKEMAARIILSPEGKDFECISDVSNYEIGKLLDRISQGK